VKKKIYAVAKGRQCGIFTDWPSAEAQVKGYAGAGFRSFMSREEAERWLQDPVYEKKVRSEGRPTETQKRPGQRQDAITVYTDGGCLGNPGPGGYGIIIEAYGEQQEISGGYRVTTNNRMEMIAAVFALEKLRQCAVPIDLFSDSSYLVNGITRGWAEKWRSSGWRKADGGAVKNVDLWQRLLALVEVLDVCFHWVRGHAGSAGNERCDKLAVAAARQGDLPADLGYQGSAVLEEKGCA
jgi:ribonuclease HI